MDIEAIEAKHQLEIDALKQQHQQDIDALHAKLSLHDIAHEKRLAAVEISLAKLVDASARKVSHSSRTHYSSSALNSACTSAAATPSFKRPHAAEYTSPLKRARSGGRDRGGKRTLKCSDRAAHASEDDDEQTEAAASNQQNISWNLRAFATSSSSLSVFLCEGDEEENGNDEDDDDDDDDNDGFCDGGDRDDSFAVATAAAALAAAPTSRSSATLAATPASATGGFSPATELVVQAADAAWKAAIGAARARVNVQDTFGTVKARADNARSDLNVVARLAANSALTLTAAKSRLEKATSTSVSAKLSLSNLKKYLLIVRMPHIIRWLSRGQVQLMKQWMQHYDGLRQPKSRLNHPHLT